MHSEKLPHLWCSFYFSSILMYRLEAIELRLPVGIHSIASMRHVQLDSLRPLSVPWHYVLCPGIWVVQLSSGCLQSSWGRQYGIVIIVCPIALDRTGTGSLRWNSQINLKESGKSSASIQRWLSWVLIRSDIYPQRSHRVLLYTSPLPPKRSHLYQMSLNS